MKLEKITESRSRRYEDACATAHALDLLGERWALLVVRELMFGPKRFGDLRASLPGISANVLTQRLEGLEAAGILLRRRLPPPASAQVYELTEWGQEAEPIFRALGRWAARSPSHDPTLPFSAASLLLSLRTMLDAERARGISARFGLRLGAETFAGTLAEGRITLVRGTPAEADFILEGPPPLVAAAIYGGQGLAVLDVTGDRALAERFLTLFPLPEKASVRSSARHPPPPSAR
jgi:DNA-binding HxlR family transcriptional regulator